MPAEELGPPHGRLTGHAPRTRRTSTGLPRSARTSCDRGGCPLYRGDDGAHPGLMIVLSRRLPLPPRPAPRPCPSIPSTGVCLTRHQRGFKQFARPIFPSPAAARMERAAASAFPRASHPADQEPDDARRGGDRPSSTDLKRRSRHQPNLQSRVFTQCVRPRVAGPTAVVSSGGFALRALAALRSQRLRARGRRAVARVLAAGKMLANAACISR